MLTGLLYKIALNKKLWISVQLQLNLRIIIFPTFYLFIKLIPDTSFDLFVGICYNFSGVKVITHNKWLLTKEIPVFKHSVHVVIDNF